MDQPETPREPGFAFVPMPTDVLFDVRLSDGAKVLWAVLYQIETTGDGPPFEITVNGMVELTRRSKPTVIKHKKELVDSGWLQEVAWRGLGQTNLYRVVVPGSHSPAPEPAPVDPTPGTGPA